MCKAMLLKSRFAIMMIAVCCLLGGFAAVPAEEDIAGQEGDSFDVPSVPHNTHLGPGSLDIVPTSPTSVGNCIPFGNNVDFGFAGFIYRNIPAFELRPGCRFAFDLGSLNDKDIRRNIYFAVANKNPEPSSNPPNIPSQGIKVLENTTWTQVVSDSQIPQNPRGNNIKDDYELIYTAQASFSFPGGGLIIGFGASPADGEFADKNCDQVLVRTEGGDASGFFYARFFNKPHLSLDVLDIGVGGLGGNLAGIVIEDCGPPPTMNDPPTVTCPAPNDFECDGNSSATVNLTANVSDPDGDSLTVEWSIGGVVQETDIVASGSGTVDFSHTYAVGTSTVVTVSVTDGEDTDTCTTTVTVVDTGFPTIICASDVTVPTDLGECDAVVTLTNPLVADNCDVASVTNDAPVDNVFPLGDSNVTWTVTDVVGNTATCVQVVTVVDLEPPLITCPADFSVVHDPGFCDAIGVDVGSATAFDDCSALVIITNNAPAIFPLNTTVVVWTATDPAGNSSSCVQLVTVTNEGPTAVPGADITAECDSNLGRIVSLDGTGSSDPDDPTASLSFLWTAVGITFEDDTSPTPTAQFPIGSTTVSLLVIDPCGKSDTFDVIVVVQDTTAPQIQSAIVDQQVLWPPNHKMVPIALALLVSDTCENPQDLLLSCQVSSDEPDDANGDGAFTGDVDGQDGFTSPVSVSLSYNATLGVWEGTFDVRAERDGGQDGRKYSITCVAMDDSGNMTTATVGVTVPHSLKGGKK